MGDAGTLTSLVNGQHQEREWETEARWRWALDWKSSVGLSVGKSRAIGGLVCSSRERWKGRGKGVTSSVFVIFTATEESGKMRVSW